ncbi:MAG: hypothetical protein R2746_15725 [Acidimicrobiales bacterium]
MVGLAFVRWLATQGTADVGVALLGPGPLEPHYRRAASTTVAAPRPWAVDALARAVPGVRARRPRPAGADPQVVVANTLAALAPPPPSTPPARLLGPRARRRGRARPPGATAPPAAPRVHRWVAAGPGWPRCW